MKTYELTFTTGRCRFTRQVRIKAENYKSATDQLFKMYISINTTLLDCRELTK